MNFKEKIYYKLSEINYRRKGRIKLKDMLSVAEIPVSSLDNSLIPLLNHPVRQISFVRKRMVPDSLAFGLFCESQELMKKALSRGAFAIVVKEAVPGIPCIIVDNPMETYGKMCAYYRDLYPQIKTTAVTGSIGKTTVKNMVASVYRERYRTLVEPLNENEPDIIGFSAQHLSRHIDRWVQEVAESVPGSARSMSLIMKPDVVIITALENAHIGRLGSMDVILDESCGVATHLDSDGIVIINRDEFPALDRLGKKRIVSVSESDESADYYAKDIEIHEDGLHYTIVENGATGTTANPIHLKNIFARHNVLNSLYAYAAGRHSGITPETIARGLGKYRTYGFRNNVYKSDSGKDIIYADCYNAVERSVRAALNAAGQIPLSKGGKRIAILGDIQELGDKTAEEHLAILRDVNQSQFDTLILRGDYFNAASKDFPFRKGLEVFYMHSNEEIVSFLRPSLSKGNLYLFKASHSGHLEECIQEIWPSLFRKKEKEELKLKKKWKLQTLLP